METNHPPTRPVTQGKRNRYLLLDEKPSQNNSIAKINAQFSSAVVKASLMSSQNFGVRNGKTSINVTDMNV